MHALVVTTRRGQQRWWVQALLGLAVALLFGVLALQIVASPAVDPGPDPLAGPSAVAQTGVRALMGLPVAAQGPISTALGRDITAYHLAGRLAVTPDQDLRAAFSRRGVTISSGRLRLTLRLQGFGPEGAVRPLPVAEPRVRANRVSYSRGAVTESWANGPLGLEQSFIVRSQPSGPEPLALSIETSGSVQARLDAGGVLFTDGRATLRYGGLVATDATGRALPAHMRLRRGRVLILVDDRDASFPIRIDPIVQQSELIASDGGQDDHFGFSVAISGSTAVVGAYNQTVNGQVGIGAAYVFVEPTDGWASASSQVAKLDYPNTDPPNKNPEPAFGYAVGISGGTIAVGAPDDNSGVIPNPNQFTPHGTVFVFTEPTAGWSGTPLPDAQLLASDPGTSDMLGTSVAIDGDTIVAGAPFHSPTAFNQGAVYLFQMPAAGWSGTAHQTAELLAQTPVASDELGLQVAISGQTVVAGVPERGLAYVFQPSAAGWGGTETPTATLTETGAPSTANTAFGFSVAVSGTTIAVGAPHDTVGTHSEQGRVYVFNEPSGSSGWSGSPSPSAELTASDGGSGNELGESVAMSGSMVAAGELSNPTTAPAVYVFEQPASGWSGSVAQTAELTGSDEAPGAEFGTTSNTNQVLGSQALAVSCQSQILVGANLHAVSGKVAQGAAYVFGDSGSTAMDRSGDLGDRRLAPHLLPSPFGCPLYVQVTRGDSTSQSPFDMDSGLSLSRGASADVRADDIVFKTGELDAVADGGTFPGRCLSGCTDLMATVGQGQTLGEQGQVTGTNDPVSDAEVTATISGVSADGRITNPNAKPGTICTVAPPGVSVLSSSVTRHGLTCDASSVTGESDSSGQVRFRYWGPASWGSPDDSRPEIHLSFQASATSTCSAISCSSAHSSIVPAVIKVQPHVVWWKNAHLTAVERKVLVDWSHEDRIASDFRSFAGTLAKLKVFDNKDLQKVLKTVKNGSEDVKLTGRASDAVILLWFIHKFDLATDGLYSPVNFARVQDQLLGLIKKPGVSFVADKLTDELFGKNHLFDDQVLKLLKDYGGFGPGTLRANPEDHIAYVMTLKAYEASYCVGSDFLCGGSSNSTLVTNPLVKGQGAHFNLYFAFSSQDSSRGTAVFFDPGKTTFNIDTGYIPRTWIPAQCRILCVGHGEHEPPD
jgi:hypothetical protein